MATLLNWLEDPLKKKLDLQNQARSAGNSLGRANGGFISGVRNMTTQNQPKAANAQTTPRTQSQQPSIVPRAPFKANSLSLSQPLASRNNSTSQLNLRSSSPLKLNTLNNSGNQTLTTLGKTTLSPTLNLSTSAPNLTNKTTSNQQDNNAGLSLDRANQAKARYDSLRDNNNEFWGKYQSALETTKDQYKNLLGESIQSRSANQLGSGLKKMTTEQGSLPASGEEFVNKYRSLSNDDKWDVWQSLQKAKTTLSQAIGKADDESQEELKNAYGTLLSEVAVYDDMIANEDRGKKSLGKSFGDWITSGGIVGNMAEPATNALGTLSEIMGNKGGAETARAISQNNANQNYGNNKVFDVANFAGSTVGNIAGNMVTGGAYGLVNAGLGLADSAASAITDRNRNYYTDADGNLVRENQSTGSKLAGLGNSALNAGLTVAGMKGFGPNINFRDGQTLQGLLTNKNFGEVGKAMGKYAAKEVPFALATTAASQGMSALGGDKNFTDGFGTELANNIVGDLAVDLTGAVRQGKGGNRDLFKPGTENDPSALQTLERLGRKVNNELNERGGIGLTTKIVSDDNSNLNQKLNLGQKAKSSLDTIKSIMSGNNTQRLAYAGTDGSSIPKMDISKTTSTDMSRSFSIYEGQDGKAAVKIDDPTFLDNTPVEKYESSIRKAILDKFQGKKLKVGQTDNEALVSGKTAGKISRRGGAINDDIAYKNKGETSRQLDELVNNLHNIRTEPNNSNRPQKRGVASVTKGEIEVDINGKKYYPTVVIRNYADGRSVVHEISNIKRTAIGSNEPVWSDNFHKNGDSQSPNRTISQIPESVKTENLPVEVVDKMKGKIEKYQQKYGDDFYDKMPSKLQDHYDALLDLQPRDRSRAYTDPVTGEKWIDETANPEIDLKKYVKEQVAAQKTANRAPIKQKVQDTIDNLKHYLVDDAVAYERYVKDKGDRLNLREGVDRVRTSDAIAKQMIEDSGLSEVIGKMSTNDANEFQQYLIAKRSQELKRTKGNDFRTGRNDIADQALIRSVGDKYAAQEKVVREFNQKMLDYAADSGLISGELRDQLIRDNTDYVPMNRVLDDIADMGMHKSKQIGNLGKQTAVQKIEGSDRIVQNPLESMIRNAIRTVNEGERNKVARTLSETAAFREARLPEGAKPKAGNDKLSFIVNGEKVDYEVPALVAKEMKGLNGVMPDFMQSVITVFGAPTKVLRTGATGANPMFAISNLVRDQLQTTITGSLKANIKGTPKALKATFGIGKEGKAMQAELARQGIIGSEYRQTYGYKSGELVKELQQAHQLPRQAWEKLKHPIDTLADVIGKTEYFTRAQQYYGTDGTTTEKSQAARNNTLNFGRAGATVRVLNKVIPFLNAGVQGGRITVNQFKERPVRTTMAVAAFAGIAAAVRGINSAQNQELWDRIGDEEKQSNLIIFGDDAHYDPETNRVVGVTKIPLPQMVYPITDAVNNLKGKPEDLMMLGGDIFTAITGIDAENPVNQLTPTAGKPLLETAMNKNFYTGQEIVSDYDSNLDPEDKGKKYTTGVARSVAKATGIDAPIIDNFIQNWGGGLFKDLTKVMTDNPDNKSDGGGVGEIFSQGAFRRFMSASVESQYDIQATLAEDYKKKLKADPAFQALDANEQKKALDRIDTDTKAIAGFAAKTEQGRTNEITSELSKRQKDLMQDGFDVNNYNKPSKNGNGHSVEISESLGNEYKQILDKYNSMEKEDWERYIYTTEGREAEYKLAEAKFENDKANGNLTEVQELKRKKELRKLKVSRNWNKDVRDAYSLAGSRADMQNLLGELDNRADMVGYLNALNRAMYDAGVISASTYKSRNRNINNLESSKRGKGKRSRKSAYSAASRTALSAYAKALASGNEIKVNSGTRAPSTSRRMNAVALATNIKKANLGTQARVSVKKGIK